MNAFGGIVKDETEDDDPIFARFRATLDSVGAAHIQKQGTPAVLDAPEARVDFPSIIEKTAPSVSPVQIPQPEPPRQAPDLHPKFAHILDSVSAVHRGEKPPPPADDVPWGARLLHAANRFTSGIAELPAGMLDFTALVAKELDDLYVSTTGLTGAYQDKKVKDLATARAAQRVREVAASLFPDDERLQGDFVNDVLPSALGSMVGFAAGGLATGGARALATRAGAGMAGKKLAADAVQKAAQRGSLIGTGVAAVGMSTSSAYRDASANAGDKYLTDRGYFKGSGDKIPTDVQEEADKYAEESGRLAARWAIAPGVVESLPIIRAFGRFYKGGKLPDGMRRYIAEGSMGALEEAITEVIGEGMQNAIAQQIWDNDRSWAEGLIESGAAGGVSGFLMSFLMTAAGAKVNRGRLLRHAKERGIDVDNSQSTDDLRKSIMDEEARRFAKEHGIDVADDATAEDVAKIIEAAKEAEEAAKQTQETPQQTAARRAAEEAEAARLEALMDGADEGGVKGTGDSIPIGDQPPIPAPKKPQPKDYFAFLAEDGTEPHRQTRDAYVTERVARFNAARPGMEDTAAMLEDVLARKHKKAVEEAYLRGDILDADVLDGYPDIHDRLGDKRIAAMDRAKPKGDSDAGSLADYLRRAGGISRRYVDGEVEKRIVGDRVRAGVVVEEGGLDFAEMAERLREEQAINISEEDLLDALRNGGDMLYKRMSTTEELAMEEEARRRGGPPEADADVTPGADAEAAADMDFGADAEAAWNDYLLRMQNSIETAQTAEDVSALMAEIASEIDNGLPADAMNSLSAQAEARLAQIDAAADADATLEATPEPAPEKRPGDNRSGLSELFPILNSRALKESITRDRSVREGLKYDPPASVLAEIDAWVKKHIVDGSDADFYSLEIQKLAPLDSRLVKSRVDMMKQAEQSKPEAAPEATPEPDATPEPPAPEVGPPAIRPSNEQIGNAAINMARLLDSVALLGEVMEGGEYTATIQKEGVPSVVIRRYPGGGRRLNDGRLIPHLISISREGTESGGFVEFAIDQDGVMFRLLNDRSDVEDAQKIVADAFRDLRGGEVVYGETAQIDADAPVDVAAPETDGLRRMNADGRPVDGQPIKPGDIFATSSGRATTPYPKYNPKRTTKRDIRNENQWLIDNAIAEAEARGDDFNLTTFRGEDAGNLPPASVSAMQEYLFGEQPPVAPPITQPLVKGDAAPEAVTPDAAPEQPRVEVSENTIIKDDAYQKAMARMKARMGEIRTLGFDPEAYADGVIIAGYHIERGARTFAAYAKAVVEVLGDKAKPYLASWYKGARALPEFAPLRETMTADADVDAFAADIDAILREDVAPEQEKSDISGEELSERTPTPEGERDVIDERGDTNLEPDGAGTGIGDGVGQTELPLGSRRDGAGGEPGIPRPVGAGDTAPGGVGVSGYEAAAAGTGGDFSPFTEAPGDGGDTAGGELGIRGGEPVIPGAPIEPGGTEDAGGLAQERRGLDAKIEQQRQAQSIPVVPADRGNVAETLPILMAGQQDDVVFAEQRFARPDGYGVLFTNGTGTGKTFTGLGIINRAVRQGKKNILIVVPSDKIANDWVATGKYLQTDITQLPSTQDAGQGVVVTTYANFGQNNQITKREWDLVVMDEAHYLMQAKDGNLTDALNKLRAVTYHPRGEVARVRSLHAQEYDRLSVLRDTEGEVARREEDEIWRRLDVAQSQIRAQIEGRQGAARPRVVFLSATPFAYEKTVDWAEGYLFNYPQAAGSGYNQGDGYEQFMMQHFGYRMRYNKLTEPGPEVNRGVLQRQFNSFLKRERVLSARVLDSDFDYDRKFILTGSEIGTKIDEGLEWLFDRPQYRPVLDLVRKQFDHLSRRFLLEAIKAKEAIPIIQSHLDMGRKVVVFHDFKVGGGFNPFNLARYAQSKDLVGDGVELGSLVRRFMDERADLVNLPIANLPPPIDALTRAFPDAVLFNGDIPARVRRANIEAFQDDNSGVNLIIGQSAAMKEGVSLHDVTGKYPRVLINLGLPTQPTTSIQQEGRIYRVGQASNAMFRYLNTGTNWERWAFATTIAQRSSAAENLALGEEARALMDAYIQGFEESDAYPAGHDGEGTGGKERDRAAAQALTEWDRAIALYFSQQKKTARTKAQEGVDYFATPEPLGLKMVEWADIRDGESALEPSAGHGAIARWLPDHIARTVVEPSVELSSRLRMVMDGEGVRVLQEQFEDLHVGANKFDAIVMNPPFGHGGSTAIAHVAKAAEHLRDGGRIVALIPDGGMADRRFDAWFYPEDAAGGKKTVTSAENMYLVADIKLPDTVFERAGTRVKTRIVVLEKQTDPERAREIRQTSRDYSDVGAVQDLFARIEEASIPSRRKPATPEVPQQRSESAGSVAGKMYETDAPEVTHTTRRGKTIRGVIAKDLTESQAQEIDPYTWKKDGGYFIRMNYVRRPGQEPRFAAPDAAPATREQQSQPIASRPDVVESVGAMRAGIRQFFGRDGGFRVVMPQSDGDKALAEMGRRVGREVAFYRYDEGVVGMPPAQVDPLNRRRIWVQVGHDAEGAKALFFHEFVHTLRSDNPEAYGQLHAFLRKNAPDILARAEERYLYLAGFAKDAQGNPALLKNLLENREKLDEESIASLAELISPEIAARMQAENPGLLRRLIDYVKRVMGRLGITGPGGDRAIRSQVAFAADGFVNMLERAAAGGEGGTQAADVRGVNLGGFALKSVDDFEAFMAQIQKDRQARKEAIRQYVSEEAGGGAVTAGDGLHAYLVTRNMDAARREANPWRVTHYGKNVDRSNPEQYVATSHSEHTSFDKAVEDVVNSLRENVREARFALAGREAATANIGTYDPTNPDIRFALAQPPANRTFAPATYSAVRKAAEDKMPPTMKAASALSFIQKQPGVKKEELRWTGLDRWLGSKERVTKQEVLDYLDEHQVEVRVIERGKAKHGRFYISDGDDEGVFYDTLEEAETRIQQMAEQDVENSGQKNAVLESIKEADGKWEVFNPDYDTTETFDTEEDARIYANELIGDYVEAWRERYRVDVMDDETLTGARFGRNDLVLPGAVPDSYREILLTWPVSKTSTPTFKKAKLVGTVQGAPRDKWTIVTEAGENIGWGVGTEAEVDYALRENRPGSEREGRLRELYESQMRKQEFRSAHFPNDPNVLAHLRLNERLGENGERILFLEEIQSDWAQKGRDVGFKEPGLEQKNFFTWLKDNNKDISAEEMERQFQSRKGEEVESWAAEQKLAMANASRVSDAPFITDTNAWVTLALKHAIRYAAEGGFDAVAFTTGEQQAARYDLSKHLDRIEYEPIYDDDGKPTGEYEIIGYHKGVGDYEALREEGADIERIEELVGKEIAEKIQNGEGEKKPDSPYRDWRILSDIDLKVGGEGMLAFYDRLVPDVTKALLRKLDREHPGLGVLRLEHAGADVDAMIGDPDYDSGTRIYPEEAASGETQFVLERLDDDGNWVYYGTYDDIREARENAKEYSNVSGVMIQPSFPITSTIRNTVLDVGQPLFALSPPSRGQLARMRKEALDSPYAFEDFAQWEDHIAKRGVDPPTIGEKLRERKDEIVRRFTREWEHLPRGNNEEGAYFAKARAYLTNLNKQGGLSVFRADEQIRKVVESTELSGKDYDLFANLVFLEDQEYMMREGKPLSNNWTEEKLKAEIARQREFLDSNPRVQAAMEARKQMWNAVRADYIRTMKDIGFDVAKRFMVQEREADGTPVVDENGKPVMVWNEAYFRHQVLEHVAQHGAFGQGAGKKIMTPTYASYLRKRAGGFEINTDYLEAEYEVLSKMFYDMELAKFIKLVKDDYDIFPQLQREAKAANDAAIHDWFVDVARSDNPTASPEEITELAEAMYKALNRRQAIAFSRLSKMAAEGTLPDTADFRWEDVIDSLANGSTDPATFQYAAWVLKNHGDTEAGAAAALLFKGVSQKRSYIAKTLEKLGQRKTYKDFIPGGFVEHPIRDGNVFYQVYTVPEKSMIEATAQHLEAAGIPPELARQVLSSGMEMVGIPKDQIGTALAKGQKYRPVIIREELAATMGEFRKAQQDDLTHRALRSVTLAAKVLWLTGPRRLPKYVFRNLTGDGDKTVAGNAKAFRHVPEAFGELHRAIIKGQIPESGDLRKFFEWSGISASTLSSQELGEADQMGPMVAMAKKYGGWKEIPARVWQGWWRGARMTTNFQELILRYANFKEYLSQMRKNPDGMPDNYGASFREEVKAIDDIYARAYKLQNELLGSYDAISVEGQKLRQYWIPFWSWTELNTQSYKRLFQNAMQDGRLMRQIAISAGLGAATTSRLLLVHAGKWLLATYAFTALLAAWNNIMFPDEEEGLPEYARGRSHIIFPNLEELAKGNWTGKDAEGKVIYFSRLGALDDLLEWVGLDTAPSHVRNFLNGRMTAGEIAWDMVTSPPKKLWGGVTSLGPKMAVELMTGRQTYPDPSSPRLIRDRWRYLASTVGFPEEYDAFTGKPMQGSYASTWLPTRLLTYRVDPGQTAYWEVKDDVRRWQREKGKDYPEFIPNNKSAALYNLRMAVRFGDKEAMEKYATDYIAHGGTPSGMRTSFRNMHPLAGLPISKGEKVTEKTKHLDFNKNGIIDAQDEFVAQADYQTKKRLYGAMTYYNEQLLGADDTVESLIAANMLKFADNMSMLNMRQEVARLRGREYALREIGKTKEAAEAKRLADQLIERAGGMAALVENKKSIRTALQRMLRENIKKAREELKEGKEPAFAFPVSR